MKKNQGIANLLKKYTRANSRAGARANNRFSFQEGWSLNHILDIHNVHDDYIALFDAFEDFIVFFETDTLDKAHFFQIKSREDLTWKITHLTKSPSIMQKIFNNIAENPKIISRQFLVLNGGLQILITGNTVTPNEFCFDTVEMKDFLKIEKKIKDTKNLTFKEFSAKAHCILTTLPINESDRDKFLKGRLSEFIEAQYPKHTYIVSPIYDCLKLEISNKSNYEKKIPNKEELKKRKGISKSQFNDFIAKGVEVTKVNEWQTIKTQLQGEQVDLKTLSELGKGFTDLSIELSRNSLSIKKLAADILLKIDNELPHTTRLIDLIDKIYGLVKAKEFAQGYDEKLIKALVGYEYQKR